MRLYSGRMNFDILSIAAHALLSHSSTPPIAHAHSLHDAGCGLQAAELSFVATQPIDDMATSSTIFGSVNMELEQEFRMMAIELGQQLSEGECQNIAYASSCMDERAPPDRDYRLYVFSTLEARGVIGPLKLDFLEHTLLQIGRNDLLNIIDKYKKRPIYKEVHGKKKRKGKMKKKKKDQTMQSATTTDHTAYQFKEIYACFLTQFAEIALKMRSALESNDTARMKYAFSTIASDGDTVARMLRKKLSIQMGMNRDSSSTMSSRESSGMPCYTLSGSKLITTHTCIRLLCMHTYILTLHLLCGNHVLS